MASKIVRFGICQFITVADKSANIQTARKFILDAAKQGAEVISLPEMFNCPYQKEFFREYSENIEGEGDKLTFDFLQSISKETGKWIIGGSIPEIDNEGKLYNTCLVFDRQGK